MLTPNVQLLSLHASVLRLVQRCNVLPSAVKASFMDNSTSNTSIYDDTGLPAAATVDSADHASLLPGALSPLTQAAKVAPLAASTLPTASAGTLGHIQLHTAACSLPAMRLGMQPLATHAHPYTRMRPSAMQLQQLRHYADRPGPKRKSESSANKASSSSSPSQAAQIPTRAQLAAQYKVNNQIRAPMLRLVMQDTNTHATTPATAAGSVSSSNASSSTASSAAVNAHGAPPPHTQHSPQSTSQGSSTQLAHQSHSSTSQPSSQSAPQTSPHPTSRIVSRDEALALAKAAGLDLVLVGHSSRHVHLHACQQACTPACVSAGMYTCA